MNKSKKLRKLRNSVEDECISIRKYLVTYYGININPYDIKLCHKDIQILFPMLEIVEINKILENKDNLYSFDIIPVMDCYKNIAFYKRPILKSFFELRTIDCQIYKDKDKLNLEIDLDDLSIEELSKICRLYKSLNKLSDYRSVYRILKEKKERNKSKVKEYKRENNNLIKRGFESYD